MTFIKDIFDLPDQVRQGDFVLRLSEGVIRPKETVENYVVTAQLARCFDEALDLIRAAVDGRSSKATYLHGSFGSGKSHFMAMLYLLLKGDGDARSKPELAPIVAKHNEWTVGRKFLLVPFHMVGSESMEGAILGGYVEYMRRVHPEAPTPAVYRADELFADAENLRATMGDAAFFERLNVGGENSGWGAYEGWNPEKFAAAMAADPGSKSGRDLRNNLVSRLVETFFTSARGAGQFVDLDNGLSVISRHAKSVGYDALILFLDELILWLASHAANPTFVSHEGQKLAKLVEAQTPDRPAPIVSFVARQRDLSEMVGDTITGAETISFKDVLKYWEARFATIRLEDRNLPVIANKRVLKTRSEATRQLLDEAFKKTSAIRDEVMDVLLTTQADRDMFRLVYPFSPALVETLVAVSSLLQRERTAIRVMLQILVERKETLKLGEIIPVGDLFDAMGDGSEAFSEGLRVQFDNAKKLYAQKLRPLIESENGIKFEEAEHLPPDDPKVKSLRADDRLAKTLLLSALAPNVESLRGLTTGRLAALNHGTLISPIPGRESQLVLQKVRKWAAGGIGQIRVGDDNQNPTVSVQLTGVDTDTILLKAQSEDNTGNQIRKIKELLFDELGIDYKDEIFISFTMPWRATRRTFNVAFGNVRELTDDVLKTDDEWRVFIDYPFDRELHSPMDDRSRLENFLELHPDGSRAIAWLPTFLSHQARKELGTLVRLDFILTGDRFRTMAEHLNQIDQLAARTALESQREQLKNRIKLMLAGVYGITNPSPGSVDATINFSGRDHFQSLVPGLTLNVPAAADLRGALEKMLDQALQHQFPAHPNFDPEAKLNLPTLNRARAVIERAIQTPDHRVEVEQPQRKEIRMVVNPLRLGEMAETHFVLGHHWVSHFDKKASEHGGPLTVKRLRQWMDEPEPMGLPRDVQDLVILAFAAQTNRSFFKMNVPHAVDIGALDDLAELREEILPPVEMWNRAVELARAIFELSTPALLSPQNLARFSASAREKAEREAPGIDRLASRLAELASRLGVTSTRVKTAVATRALVGRLSKAQPADVVRILAEAEISTTPEAMGAGFRKAAELNAALENTRWELLESVRELTDARATAGRAIWQSVLDAFEKDELAVALGPALREAEHRAVKLLVDAPKPAPVAPDVPAVGFREPVTQAPFQAPPVGTPEPVVVEQGEVSAAGESELTAVFEQVASILKADARNRVRLRWEVYR